MTRYFVTGGAGFIGSNLVDRLLADGHAVTALDNFSTGQRSFLEGALRHRHFSLAEADLLHLAANADVRFGTHHPRRDLEQNTIATFHVLDAMRRHGVKRVAFSSTGSV